ncbi:MAG: DEAD/DEAH box helicase [Acetobacteraceae bacterium]|nr:DEAD/DEAH box helicase [Acetobacteraceae bacterium]
MTSFADLGLAAPILKALQAEGYTTPTPIQAQAIPHVLAGRDVQGIAQTGTGKTAAFALPILHRLLADRRPPIRRGCRVLVLSPTRELASQIADNFRAYARHTGLRTALMFGGVPKPRQAKAVAAGVDVLVATPGRLLDHMQEGAVTVAGTEILVLDEADHMLDLGFIVPIRKIVSAISAKRQTLFFSATMPKEIAQLAGSMLRDPVHVAVAPVATTAERVEQKVIFVEAARKRQVLASLLRNKRMERTLVFTRTKHGADKVTHHLEASGQPAAAIHGNKSQPQRERALAAFKEGRVRVLVATDIAARGIDVDGVTHVVNFDLPNVPEAYVHRIGRTARAGHAGIAISFCDSSERTHLRGIEKLIRTRLPVEEPEALAA